jgi:NAD(P)-dependent dehydrogenase (short-subunit alcohol dehydrogenase family)
VAADGAGASPFAGTSAIVTGGASGIDLALGRRLGLAGAHVVLADLAVDDAVRQADASPR